MKNAFLVYPGLGKSTLANIDNRFEDLETKIFKDMDLKQYIGKREYPNYRGIDIVNRNPEYPNNLKKYTLEKIEQNKILLLVFKQDSIDLLSELNIDYDIILPDKDRLKQLRQDYISRGDNLEYIEKNLTTRYEDSIKYAQKLNKNILFLKNGEYLKDLLDRIEQ